MDREPFVTTVPIRNSEWQTKPMGGLWGSRADDSYGWKEWCKENYFELSCLKHSFRFTLPAARILTLNTPDDLKPLPKLHPWKPADYSELLTFEEENPGKVPPINRHGEEISCPADCGS